MRKVTYAETDDDNDAIDIVELKARDWAHMYKIVAGLRLGGDYIHLIVEHSGMLLRLHRYCNINVNIFLYDFNNICRSLATYMNEGFESAHKLQRLLWSLCTFHNGGETNKGEGVLQMLQHFYATFMLDLRSNYYFKILIKNTNINKQICTSKIKRSSKKICSSKIKRSNSNRSNSGNTISIFLV